MTLDEGIKHAQEIASKDCSECAKDHQQLADWLIELKGLKESINKTMTIEERASMLYKPIEADNIAEISRNSLSESLKEAYIAGAESQKTIMLGRLIEFMNCLMLDTRVKERMYEYLAKD